MGLGVLDTPDGRAPGTVWVYEAESRRNQLYKDELATGTRGLKFDRSGKEPIILVPQPSDDPNDPLNWPLWKRDVILFILCLMSVIASTLSPLLAADSLTLLLIYRTDFNKVALLTGWHLLGVGVAGFFFVASARIWGKRHLYLLGTCLIIASTAWGGSTGRDYTSMLWSRVIQGVGLAPFEALVNASVGDLYFVHQRGLRMAVSNMALFGGAFFTPILVGKIAHEMGWEWTFYFVSIFSGVMLPLMIFFVPETAYRRDDSLNTDILGDSDMQVIDSSSSTGANESNDGGTSDAGIREHAADVEKDAESDGNGEGSAGQGTSRNQPSGAIADSNWEKGNFVKKTFVRVIGIKSYDYLKPYMPFNGRKTDESYFKLVLRPLPLFFHPGIFWSCLTQGCLIGWTVLIGVVLAALFLGPPLWFNEVQTGYLYAGPFIGALLGFILAGLVSDWSTRVMIKWNKGVYEPEFRILLVIPQLIFGCIGLYGFGFTTNVISGWILPVIFFGFEVAGMVLGAVASALYIVDAHREIAIEGFTCLMIFKNVFSFGMTFRAYDWLVHNGPERMFIIVSSIQVGIFLTSIPMYIFGKRNRAFMAKYDLLKLVWLR